ncbi:hypothetical protein FA950_30685, partial [Bacillus thuringiensis]
QQFGHRHKLRLLTIGRGHFGHPRVAALGLLHAVRGTGTDQRGRLALRLPRLGFSRLALRMAEAAGITLAGFARPQQFGVYSHPQFIAA